MRHRKDERQTSMELEKAVALDDNQVAAKNTHIRTLLREIKGLKAESKQLTSRNRKRIAEAEAEIDREMEQIDQGIELRKQGQLFAKDDAQRALHDVAEKVDPALTGDGNGGKPKPSDPHPFESGPKGQTDECRLCGGDLLDPIHRDGLVVEKPRAVPRGPLARARKRGPQTSAKGARA